MNSTELKAALEPKFDAEGLPFRELQADMDALTVILVSILEALERIDANTQPAVGP